MRNPLYASLCLQSISNGFSYYCSNKVHKHFIPYVCDYPFLVDEPNDLTVGFYLRPAVVPDSFYFLVDWLMSSKKKSINLITCGNLDYHFCYDLYAGIKTWRHTYDTEDFFNSITHYLCPMSKDVKDPFPNMLMEAIQTQKQIICPKIEGRYHKDGIDDLLSLLPNGFHSDLNHLEKIYLNPNHGLTTENFRSFYNRVINNNYENILDYHSYRSFYDWCAREL